MSTQEDFINSVLHGAVEIQTKTGLPAAVMIAQAILETGWGKSVCKDINTGQYSYSLFNIKGTGPAGSVLVWTWEEYNGKSVKIKDSFRAYHNYAESFADYAKLITGASRYKPAVAVANDPIAYAYKIKECGYATDSAYPGKLINLMETWNLIERVKEALNLMKIPIEVEELKVLLNGQPVANSVLLNINGRDTAYIPANVLRDAGIEVTWDEPSNTVKIVTKQ